jgi:hypothetical protein
MGRKNRNAASRHVKPRRAAEGRTLFAFPREGGGLEVREVGFTANSSPLTQHPFAGLAEALGGAK